MLEDFCCKDRVHASSKGNILNKLVSWISDSTYVWTPVTFQALVWLARRRQSYHGDFHGLGSTASSDAFPGSRVTPPACWLKTGWGFAWAKANPKLVSQKLSWLNWTQSWRFCPSCSSTLQVLLVSNSPTSQQKHSILVKSVSNIWNILAEQVFQNNARYYSPSP